LKFIFIKRSDDRLHVWFRIMDNFLRENIFVILSNPSSSENIGLVARGMKNTGYRKLRLVLNRPLSKHVFKTAVHSEEILKNAFIFPHISEAVKDMNVVFASTARHRKNFPSLDLEEAVEKMFAFSSNTKIGLVFGNERTGLVSDDLRHSNYRFSLPQAEEQPSYNLASAVLLTLFQLFIKSNPQKKSKERTSLISRKQQEECIRLIIKKLENKKFIHEQNKKHVIDMIHDLFGRLEMREKDRRLLLAVFSKGVDKREKQ